MQSQTRAQRSVVRCFLVVRQGSGRKSSNSMQQLLYVCHTWVFGQVLRIFFQNMFPLFGFKGNRFYCRKYDYFFRTPFLRLAAPPPPGNYGLRFPFGFASKPASNRCRTYGVFFVVVSHCCEKKTLDNPPVGQVERTKYQLLYLLLSRKPHILNS